MRRLKVDDCVVDAVFKQRDIREICLNHCIGRAAFIS